ncbi:MAG: ABC transporter ATP-binding protein [Anaerolineae bacterium]|nr:ABC transporter ATP-binding protein [Anaerolineae bacterium]
MAATVTTGKREFTLEHEHQYNRSGPGRWILSHVARYPLLPLIAVGAAVLNNWFYVNIQVGVGQGFDLITSEGWEIAGLVSIALMVLLSASGQGLTGLARNYGFEFLAQRFERDSRDELYVSLLGKSQSFHGRQRIGDVMARATNDVRQMNYMFSPGVMLITDSLMAVVVPFTVMAGISVQLLLVPAIFIVFLIVTVWDYNRRLGPVSEATRDEFGEMNAGLAEAIAGISVVKGNAQELQELKKFSKNARKYRDLIVKQGEIQAFYLPMLVFVIARAAAFLHSLLLWQQGVITLGEVVAYFGVFGALQFPTFISIFSFNLVQLGVASAARILELVNTQTEMDENEGGLSREIAGEVTFEDVTFSYNGTTVLKNITFTARPGETIAIVGQTGSGKTTLTRLINRIFDADSGRVLVDGVDVRQWSLESLRSQISTIEQDVFLFSRTLAENVAFGHNDATREQIEHAALEAQAHEFISGFSEGYETEVGERGVTLSGGQRQRIAIARAFLTNPRILILDDSTSAIDSATEDLIQRAMQRISSERTTFIITHRLSQIRWADRIIVLRRGELVDQGTHEDLLERSADYRRIFERYE